MIIAIYGLGLIGGSLGRAILEKTNNVVYGTDADPSALIKARLLKAITNELTEEKLKQADLVLLAVNPSVAVSLLPEICPLLKPGATVSDCCGNKRKVIEKMEEMHEKYPELGFIGTHPMAGREFSGIEHSTSKLFEHSFAVLTPVHSGITDFEKIKGLYMSIGCDGTILADAKTHDEMISYTSQLAHIVSSAYIKNPLSSSHAGFSAGSFRDMTRVAKLSPEMWSELFLDNADFLCKQIRELINNLEEFEKVIEEKNKEKLKELLKDGVEAKFKAEKALKEKRKEN